LRRYIYVYGIATDRFLEIQAQFVAQVSATKYLAAALPAATAKDIAEHVTENVAETFGPEATSTTGLRFEAIVSEAIIGCPFIRIAQDFVSFLRFLELRFRACIICVSVGMVLHCETTIGLLDLVGGCRS
jgi:hypothetical protein